MTTSGTPTISVIICTYNRHELLRRALDSVLMQDMTDFEVIIVDDGSDDPVDLPIAYLDRVRMIRTEHRGVGAARSEGLQAARGTFVAYCDDDDEWKPYHLSKLLQYLLEHPDVALVYGDSEWVQAGVPSRVPYSIDYQQVLLSEENYIFASDVMHRASAARDVGGFDPSLQAYEDWDLWLRMSQVYVLRHVPLTLATHHWHAACVGATEQWDEWSRVYQTHRPTRSRAKVAARFALELAAAPVVPFDPSTWQQERKELIWYSVLRPEQSYAIVSRQLLLSLVDQGIDITIAPKRDQVQAGFERFYRPLDHWGKLGFYYAGLPLPNVLKCERIINYAMWETTLVPRDHVEGINRFALLQYVPCQQNVESFQECGVRVPIKVLHHAVHASQFPYLSRSHPECFTFGTFGYLSPRKGIDVLIRAFQDEFLPREPVRLLMKSRKTLEQYEANDPRVILISSFVDQDALLEFLRQLDVFVLPSRGEGFGLCGLEAMSTGLPLIATNWSGPAEYLDPDDSFPLSYRLVDAQGTQVDNRRFFGMWAEPDYEHLRYLMRWLYEHPDEAAVKGRAAAERVHKEWTWERVAQQMIADLNAVAGA